MRTLLLFTLAVAAGAQPAPAPPAGGAGAGKPLSIVGRFGPDGMPFTHDDPLAVGGGAAPMKFGAMVADSCSEEKSNVGDFKSAHGHIEGPGHPRAEGDKGTRTAPDLSAANKHEPHELPSELIANEGANLVLKAPFDWEVWISGMNLASGQMTRHRAFPTDDHWTDTNTERNHAYRGWVTGWTGEEAKMEKVLPTGSKVKDLHLATLGLSYRDVKPWDGWALGVHWETLDHFKLEIKDRFKPEFGGRLDMLAQQGYVQGWVAELLNLNNFENGISGNFVVDVAGANPLGTMGFSEGKMGCNLVVRDLPVELGGYAGEHPPNITFEQLAVELPQEKYGGLNQLDYVIEMGNFEGFTCLLAQMFGIDLKQLAKTMAEPKVREKMKALDLIVQTFLTDDDYKNIGLYSGLAGREAKNPGDKLVLALLEKTGQFKPTEWLKWVYLGANPIAAIGFGQGENAQAIRGLLEPVVTESSTKVMTAQQGWRYNFGNTYMGKGMMIYGASDSKRPAPVRPPLAELVPVEVRKRAPDLLESFAKQWLHVRMDVVDPLEWPEKAGTALWKEYDALIAHPDELDKDGVTVDWPPPNFNFGKAHVDTFRSGSGGKPRPSGGGPNPPPVDVLPETTMQFQGMISIDPENMTYSVLGAGIGSNDVDPSGKGDIVFGQKPKEAVPSRPWNDLGWTKPRPLTAWPASGALANDTGLRWISAAANHYREAKSVVKWMWDFERDGAIDSEHAQQLADLGGSRRVAVFAFQDETQDGYRGRTGFQLIEVK